MADKTFDFAPLIAGKTVLKFGRSGSPHERTISITKNLKVLTWESGWFRKGSKIFVSKLINVVAGQYSYSFEKHNRDHGDQDSVSRSMSLHYLDDAGVACTFDFIVPTKADFTYFFNGFNFLIDNYKRSREKMSLDDLRLESHWVKADSDNNGVLSFKEVTVLLQKLNMSVPSKAVKAIFESIETEDKGSLNFSEFLHFMNKICVRQEFCVIWSHLVNKKSLSDGDRPLDMENYVESTLRQTISLAQFIQFWSNIQDQTISSEEAKELITHAYGTLDVSAKVAHELNANERKGLFSPTKAFGGGGTRLTETDVKDEDVKISFQMFCSVLSNAKNSLSIPAKLAFHQDMSQPISHYFINSSHNTYLEGDQLKSNSSVECYKRSLLAGCRCVELDCWDGDQKTHKGEPIIYHGYTLTSKILFRDVIKVIKEYGFVNSNTPVILSLEVHCGLEQQKKMASIMKDILKDSLALPLESYPEGCLPSPKELMGKVVLKGKRLAGSHSNANNAASASTAAEGGGGSSTHSTKGDADEDDDDDLIDDDDNALNKDQLLADKAAVKVSEETKQKDTQHGVHKDLSDIIMLGTGKVKKFTPEANESTPCDLMCSYTEGSMSKHIKKPESMNGWIEHNIKHLSRIYPSGARVDSSNYDPAPCWSAGNQIVALNFQTWDRPMQVNKAFFANNGNCGYVLKPSYLLEPGAVRTPSLPYLKLVINIISANLIPKAKGESVSDILDPYFNVYINGSLADKAKARTKTINNNGFNPIFNEIVKFEISRPETAVITFEIMDNNLGKDVKIGFNSFAVSSIRQGYRTVPILSPEGSSDGDFQFASFFIRCDLKY